MLVQLFWFLNHDEGYRMVIDYRLLNRKVVVDAFFMPTIETASDQFCSATIFSVIGLD
jgi:hypothetical protein